MIARQKSNASKPAAQRAGAVVKIRLRQGDKSKWEHAARREGLTLSDWLRRRAGAGP